MFLQSPVSIEGGDMNPADALDITWIYFLRVSSYFDSVRYLSFVTKVVLSMSVAYCKLHVSTE